MLMVTIFVLVGVLFKKGLKKAGFIESDIWIFVWALVIAIIFALIIRFAMRNMKDDGLSREQALGGVEKIFGWMQIVTACFLALAHGSNDVANAVGPAAAVIAYARTGMVISNSVVPFWLFAIGGLGIVLGLATYGKKVIETIGKNITEITPTRGFAAEFGAACTILVGSYYGLPLSTTQVLVGAVIGVGMARGIAGLNVNVIKKIMGSWVFTIPITATISGLFCFVARLVIN